MCIICNLGNDRYSGGAHQFQEDSFLPPVKIISLIFSQVSRLDWDENGEIYENKHLTTRKQNLVCLTRTHCTEMTSNIETDKGAVKDLATGVTFFREEHPAVSLEMLLILWLDTRLYVEWRPLLCGVTPVITPIIMWSDARHFVD